MIRSAIVALLLAFSTAAAAPESLVGGTAPIPAPGWRSSPASASNGDGFFVVWGDYRSGSGAIVGTRMTGDGRVLDPFGIRIPSPDVLVQTPQVVWDGDAYLVIWTAARNPYYGDGSVYAARVATDGRIVMEPRAIAANGATEEGSYAASNGSVSVVIYRSALPGNPVRFVVVDRNGAILEDAILPANTLYRSGFAIAATASRFVIAWRSNTGNDFRQDTINAVALDAGGHVLGDPVNVGSGEVPAIATDGTRFTIVWRKRRITTTFDSELQSRTFDADLTNGSAVQSLFTGKEITVPSVVWQGNRYEVVAAHLSPPAGTDLESIELDAAGNPLGFQPLGVRGAMDFALAANGADTLLVTMELAPRQLSPYIVGRMVRGSHAESPVVLDWSGNAHRNPQIADGPFGRFLAWTEDDGVWAARLDANGNSLDGRGVHVSQARAGVRVAFDGTSYVIAWRDEDFIGIRTISIIGNMVAEAKVFYTTPDTGLEVALAMAPDATYVVYTDDRVRVIRIPHATHTPDPEPLAVSPEGMLVDHPAAAWNGSALLVLWTEQYSVPYSDPAPWVISENVYAARVTAGLTLLDPAPLHVVKGDRSNEWSFSAPSVASNGADWLVVTALNDSDVFARRVLQNGTVGGNAPAEIAPGFQPVVTWDGERYVVAWKGTAPSLTGELLFVGTLPSTGTPFLTRRSLVTESATASAPALSPTVVAYTKVSFRPEHTGVPRTFLRALDLAAPRGRVVRR